MLRRWACQYCMSVASYDEVYCCNSRDEASSNSVLPLVPKNLQYWFVLLYVLNLHSSVGVPGPSAAF